MFLFLLIVYIIFPIKYYAEQITVMTEEWPPYNYTKSNKLTGFSTEIVRAIMKRLGVEYKIYVYPGARGEFYAKTKPNHLLFSIFRIPARESIYKWIGPLASENIYFFKMKDKNIKATALGEIINMDYTVMASHEGFVLNSLINKGVINIDKSASSTETKIKVLAQGRGDLIPFTELGVRYILKKSHMPLNTLVNTKIKLASFYLYIAASKLTDDHIIKQWQEALNSIKQEGEFQKIYNRYLNYNSSY